MKRIRALSLAAFLGTAGVWTFPLTASPRPATEPTAAEPSTYFDDLMASGKVEADLGHDAAAIESFQAIARHANAPAPLRWEALVRLGVALQRSGAYEESIGAFREVMRAYPNEPEAIRFLTLAVSGVVPGPERWSLIWKEIRLKVDRSDARHPLITVVWPGGANARETFTGEPISLDLKDAALTEVLERFASLTGLKVVAGPDITGTVTMRASSVPWDDIFNRILASQGLGYRLKGNVVTVFRLDAH